MSYLIFFTLKKISDAFFFLGDIGAQLNMLILSKTKPDSSSHESRVLLWLPTSTSELKLLYLAISHQNIYNYA